MQSTKKTRTLLLLFAGLVVLLSPGCAVDNEFLAKMPLFEAKSDRIPGLVPSYERKKMIRLKGEKGGKASAEEKEILVAQLMVEYRTSPDPNMRREAVDAMAKISHEKRDEYMKEILGDSDPFVRISALEAIGKTYNGSRKELAEIVAGHLKSDSDTDARLTAARLLGTIGSTADAKEKETLESMLTIALGDALYDKVPAIRYESMQSLQKVSGKDYGKDINRWIQFVQHAKGESNALPRERSFAEKLPTIHLPMFK